MLSPSLIAFPCTVTLPRPTTSRVLSPSRTLSCAPLRALSPSHPPPRAPSLALSLAHSPPFSPTPPSLARSLPPSCALSRSLARSLFLVLSLSLSLPCSLSFLFVCLFALSLPISASRVSAEPCRDHNHCLTEHGCQPRHKSPLRPEAKGWPGSNIPYSSYMV